MIYPALFIKICDTLKKGFEESRGQGFKCFELNSYLFSLFPLHSFVNI